ncbi:MAG: AzlC family ABC transporter permease [Peptococcaceae bacterium]
MMNIKLVSAKEALVDTMPIVVGVVPFGITCGIMGISSGLTSSETILMSLLVFAGAAQFISIAMLGAGITGGIIVFTTLLVNLRHLIMGASLAPYILKERTPLQALLAFGLTDESYAITISKIEKEGYSPDYQLGVHTFLYITWALSTIVGVILVKHITDPLKWEIDFIIPASFLVLLVPRLVDKTSLVVCSISALTAVIGSLYLPGKWYIILACLVGSMMGVIWERSFKHA